MPAPPAGPTAAEQARLAGVTAAVATNASTQATMPPTESLTAEARGAVTEPVAEAEARAEGSLILALDEQPQPSPEIETLCLQIYAAIEERRPANEDEWVRTNPRALAADAAGSMQESMASDIEDAAGQYGSIEEAPNPTAAEAGSPVSEVPGAETTPIEAAAAAPDPIPAEDLSLDADVEANRRRLEEAGANSEAAQLVVTGPVAEARAAQSELEGLAATGPAEALARQQEAIDSARGSMAEIEARALAALTGARASSTTSVAGRQHGMVGSEEQMRAQAGAEAQAIFDGARTQVTGLLDGLAERSMQRYRAETDQLAADFQADLNFIREWQDGRGGLTAWWQDNIAGWPDEIVRVFNTAEANFGRGVCDVVRQISIQVNGIIASCEAVIADARRRIEELFASLPAELSDWAQQEQARLGGELDSLSQQTQATRAAINQDLAAEAGQAVHDARAQVAELRERSQGIVGRIVSAVQAFIDDPARAIINGLLSLVGISPGAFWALVDRIGQIVNDIADDPLGFASNLLSAIGQGFQLFFDNFLTRMRDGFFDWLFGGLAAVGVNIPPDFSLRSIITFILELMGITWPRIRAILARHIGEENIALIERAYELISTLIEQGPEGIFEMIKEQLNPEDILQQILDAALDYVKEALITAVTPRIIALFNPAGAIIQAIEGIYRVLKWIFENAARIFTLVETVVNGMADIVAGNLSGMAAAVDRALTRLIAPVIDFLAGYLGLGDLPQRIQETIQGFQSYIEGILDRVIGFLVDRARALFQALVGGGGAAAHEEGAGDQGELDEGVAFTSEGESHRIFVTARGSDAVLMMRSQPQTFAAVLQDFRRRVNESNRTEVEPLIEQAEAMAATIDQSGDQLRTEVDRGESADRTAIRSERSELRQEEFDLVQKIIAIRRILRPGTRFGTQQQPIPIAWPKREASAYPTIYIGPKTTAFIDQDWLAGANPANIARIDQALEETSTTQDENEWRRRQKQVQPYAPTSQKQLPEGGVSIGLAPEFQVRVGTEIKMDKVQSTAGGDAINDVLAQYGFQASRENMDGDHVIEMQLAGPNLLENLWPLPGGENRSSGSTISRMAWDLPGEESAPAQITMAQIKQMIKDGERTEVWFQIVSTRG